MKRGKRKYGQVPQKIPGEKESGNTIWIFHWRSLCVCMHMCVYMCACMHVCVCTCACVCVHVHVFTCVYACVTPGNVCYIHITLSYFQSICDAN